MAVDSVLTFATEGILTKLTNLAAQEFRMAWGFEPELTKLSQSLSILQDFLAGAAEKAHEGGKAVEDWVKKLKDIADEADDVLDEINYEFLRRRVELQNHMGKKVLNFLSPSNPILFRQKMAHRIKKINTSLAERKSEASFIGLVAKKKDPTPQRIREDRETNAFIGKDEIVIGRKDVVSDIVTTLTNSNMNQENLSVMAIAGMPGLGKTTLAKSVYNEGAIDEFFNKKLWVCVSNTFDVNSILTAMLELLSGNVRTRQQALLTNLREELAGKRYFLVLDDVWNEESEKWEKLRSCLSKLDSAPGSKIIVTTRSGKVASLTETLPRPKLELLTTDECWSILKHTACSGGSSDIPLDLERIGRDIAKNCEGLPLMAKVLGGILHSKNSISEWSSIKESKIWNLQGADRIMSVLQLSFDNLKPPSLKQCFAYCSVFMKDDTMERDDLIQLWMAQGLLHPSSEKSNLEMEDIGNEYFDILFQSSLFQDATVDDDGIVTRCKMHDLVHDLAERVSESGSMMRNFHEIQDVTTSIIERIPKGSSGKLRSLFSNAEALPGNMLPWFKALRVLNLYLANIEELPSSIGKLEHLRYLNISETGIKRLPNSIGKLYNLQTLITINSDLEEFPKDMQNLINLRHVYCDEETKFPVGIIGKLTSLRTLPFFKVGKEMGSEIEELAGLNQLKGELTICNLEHVRNGNEAKKAKLEEKKNVRGLIFVWSEDRSITNNNNDEDVLEGLQPHLKLEALGIKYFMGAKFPSWMMSKSLRLDNLKRITFKGCKKCEKVPTLGHLPHLTFVRIDGMDNLKCVGEEIYGTEVFPALKELHITNCKELIGWMEGPKQVMVFPCLEKLEIQNCPELRKVPSHFPSLKKLRIMDCEKLTCIALGVLGCCASLRKLFVHQCPSLQSIPDLHIFTFLSELRIGNCERLESLVSSGPVSVVDLHIFNCSALQSIPDLHSFTCLRVLRILSCERLESLVSSGLQLPASLVELEINDAPNLESLPSVDNLTSLSQLVIVNCGKLKYLPPGLHCCTSLKDLRLGGFWEDLDSFPDFHLLGTGSSQIQILVLKGWPKLKSLPHQIQHFTSLTHLGIYCFAGVEEAFPEWLANLTSLSSLDVWYCENLKYLPSVKAMQRLTKLQTLTIRACPLLQQRCIKDSGPEWPKISHIPDIIIVD